MIRQRDRFEARFEATKKELDSERERHHKDIVQERNMHQELLKESMKLISMNSELGIEHHRSKFYLKVRTNFDAF